MVDRRTSLIERLEDDWKQIDAEICAFLDGNTIVRTKPLNVPGVVALLPEFHFESMDAPTTQLQARALKSYRTWLEHVMLLFRDVPEQTSKALVQADKRVTNWIECKIGLGLPGSIRECQGAFRQHAAPFLTILKNVHAGGPSHIVLVPDTNALLMSPEWGSYATIAGADTFSLIITPTVLSELDKLKMNHREQTVRDKAKSIISRIKGLRNQGEEGRLSEGVKVHKTITIRLLAKEPNFDATLSWLDSDNNDDRIIASALELQREIPTSVVVLVTADINLQNKAEMAKLPYDEPPEPQRG
jgi:rRNA-processing protein FCF1